MQAYQLNKEVKKIFPCSGKIPLTPNGLKGASKNPEDISIWWKSYPDANVGLPTGKENNLFVVDVDYKSDGLQSLDKLETKYGSLDTLTVRTQGGGLHLYFKWPNQEIRNSASKIAPGIDIRGEGGYVIAPPSKGYVVEQGSEVKEAPEWLLKLLEKPPEVVREAKSAEVMEGGRNAYLTSQIGVMRRSGLSQEAATVALHEENITKCEPPLTNQEVDRIIASIYRPEYEPLAPSIDPEELTIYNKASEFTTTMFSYLEDKDKVNGEPTGFDGLDKLLGGGKRLGELTTWCAEAKTGKNTFWHFLMEMSLSKGIPVGYASRELSPDTEVLPGILSASLQQDLLKSDITPQMKQLCEQKVRTWPLYFTPGYGYLTAEKMDAWIQALVAQGVQYFYFDHLHYMLSEPEDHKEASKLVKILKTATKKYNISIDLITQPNRVGRDDKLGMNSIKGGSAITQAADNLLFMERHKDPNNKFINRLWLDRGRSRLCKQGGEIFIEFDPSTCLFYELKQMAEHDVNSKQL